MNPDKVCNFDCVYCEVDRRTPGKAGVINLAQLRDELAALIRYARDGALAQEDKFRDAPPELTRTPRDIAFSGDGEPTMVRNFDECVQAVADVRRWLAKRGLELLLPDGWRFMGQHLDGSGISFNHSGLGDGHAVEVATWRLADDTPLAGGPP